MKKIVIWILRLEARLALRKYRPEIIAVSGNIGKTSTKEAIATVLERRFSVRRSKKSYNSDVGVTLAVLGAETGWNSPARWLSVIADGARLLLRRVAYPSVLVLELGADRPGDIARLARWLRPHIAVMTAIGEVPVHVEFFAGREELAAEKATLVRVLGMHGLAVLNADDETVSEMAKVTAGRVLSYGASEDAAVRATNYMLTYQTDERGVRRPLGIAFKLDYNGSTVPVKISGVFGKPALYAALAAAAVGIAKGMNVIEVAEALSAFHGVPGRLRLLGGLKGSMIIDDSYNASPTAMHAALDLLRDLPARRRICVLGDMLEIGRYTIQAHAEMGKRAAEFADAVITVGSRAKFYAEGAAERGMDRKSIFSYGTTDALLADIDRIQAAIGEGDLILVKASQALRLEKAVAALMAHPEQAAELLVRQEEEWQIKR